MTGIPSELELDQCLYCGAWVEDTTTVPAASQLSALANSFGEQDAYLGDDGKLYLTEG